MICPKVNPDDHWYICAVMADSMLLQKPGRNEDFTVPAVYYDRWQLCTEAAEQPAECPFAVGDVIRSVKYPAFVFHVTDIGSDYVRAYNRNAGSKHSIPRVMWNSYEIKTMIAVDNPDATC